jgi:hypothetical protein
MTTSRFINDSKVKIKGTIIFPYKQLIIHYKTMSNGKVAEAYDHQNKLVHKEYSIESLIDWINDENKIQIDLDSF